jgi:hypothetical protein
VEAQSLTTALKARNQRGFTVPWVWTRRRLAERWRVPPWVIDSAPWYEVALELQFMNIEAEVAAWRKEHPGY